LITKTIIDEFNLIAQELFKINFLNIGIGSISLKLKNDQMVINKRNKHILEDDFVKIVHILHEDMAWKEASNDVKIHSKIYETISSTKAIANILPKETLAYSLNHTALQPLDMLGKTTLGKIPIIHTNQNEWNENKEFIISKNLRHNDIVIISGIGVFIKTRDIREILRKAIILENSAHYLLNTQH